ncbi:DUF92 domain-containing protein [Pyrococcus yayanosii]|uniref:Integral membrane protein n=1 Tax=Pyrococcus yayanosii (strain CH1 / JCM 16557) TaxID=529709 RepID=F8AHK5_PYRYC|nr:TIGR00297 family protein [Pyrococcus yayanosii]AEH25376.1 Integral membrane protein [Pyrococcus yayanosii CH1]
MEYTIPLLAALGYISYRMGALNLWGSLTAVLLGYAVLTLGGFLVFGAMLAFLVMGTAATRFRAREKMARGLLDEVQGRGMGNVLGNGLGPVLFLLLEHATSADYGWAAVFSAIATANADTLASEIGKVFGRKPRLITNLRPARPGEEGAISPEGELAALLGALSIGLFALPLTSHDASMLVAVTLGGFAGANVDSLIGAALEKKGYIGNNGTNFLATLAGGLVGMATFLLLA